MLVCFCHIFQLTDGLQYVFVEVFKMSGIFVLLRQEHSSGNRSTPMMFNQPWPKITTQWEDFQILQRIFSFSLHTTIVNFLAKTATPEH